MNKQEKSPPPPPAKQHHVGILALEVYTPRVYIDQAELECYNNVPAGKYTIGLGQDAIGLVSGDVEDINSICLTVVQNLLEKYDIDPKDIGRLEVGTETLVDKSKSTKTVLMQLFAESGNTDIEGATIVNACYGGTAALLNALAWCNDNDDEDDKYAIVVAADIAAYEAGAARPTSGCGAVAVLVGRDAPLAYMGPRATHAAHVYDFYKPNHAVEYPTVDGALSQLCYYRALEDVYERFVQKQLLLRVDTTSFTAETPDYWVFHAPYNKLVQKSYGRLFLLDARRRHRQVQQEQQRVHEDNGDEKKCEAETTTTTTATSSNSSSSSNGKQDDMLLAEWLEKPIEETYNDPKLDSVLKQISKEAFQQRLGDANAASKVVGNTYTASVFLGLASLVDRCLGESSSFSDPKSIAVFSYGSGALATLYRLETRQPTTQTKFTTQRMAETMLLSKRLHQERCKVAASELDVALETRARMHATASLPYVPVYKIDQLFPGTYYLTGLDGQWRRTYARVPIDVTPSSLATLSRSREDWAALPGRLHAAGRRIACVITGTAAGLPGSAQVFGADNLTKLVSGYQCIGPVSDRDITAMLEKNVVHTRKIGPGNATERIVVDSADKCIRLAAQLGEFDLSKLYGVPVGLAQTMDVAAQVAVAAGMEALKDAGLVSGRTNDPAEWMLPEQYRDTTGVVYASSFPAMDAAVGEVMRFLQSKTVDATASFQLLQTLRARMQSHLTEEDERAFGRLQCLAEGRNGQKHSEPYEFDRKFLFRVLVLGNSQLAQLAGCRGPNTQTNAACAGSTQAIALAQDLLIAGRAERVVVVAGDNASGSTLLPWLGSGFRALGAATTEAVVADAALPFDKRRSGLLLGAGGIAIVLETEQSQMARAAAMSTSSSSNNFKVKARLLLTQYSNSAFHGAALDRNHIASELQRFLNDIAKLFGISKADIAEHGVYFSHETCTHASDSSSCSGNEVAALRRAFGDELLSKLLILNTKGFTGHPMGVSFEDVAAVEVLLRQTTPAVPNYTVPDDYLGQLNISRGGPYPCRYALRFAAGFGSQVAFALYATADAN